MNFFVKYLAVAVIASIAVYGFAPLFLKGPESPAPVEQAPRLRPVSSEPPIERVEEVPLVSAEAVARPMPSPDDGQGRRPLPAPGPVAEPPSGEEKPEVVVETVRGYTPSTDVIRSSGPAVRYWGVTLTDASLFELDGKRREDKLAGGTLVEQVGSVKSSKGEMAKLRAWRDSSWTDPCLVSVADLVRFEGGREEVDAEGVADLCRYFALSSRAEARKAELKQQAAERNPHYKGLKEVASLYNRNVEKAKRMTKERDQAKGPKRAQIADGLRKLEIENKRVEIDVKRLTKQYEAWKAAHGVESAAYDGDRQLQMLQREMGTIKPRLSLFGL